MKKIIMLVSIFLLISCSWEKIKNSSEKYNISEKIETNDLKNKKKVFLLEKVIKNHNSFKSNWIKISEDNIVKIVFQTPIDFTRDCMESKIFPYERIFNQKSSVFMEEWCELTFPEPISDLYFDSEGVKRRNLDEYIDSKKEEDFYKTIKINKDAIFFEFDWVNNIIDSFQCFNDSCLSKEESSFYSGDGLKYFDLEKNSYFTYYKCDILNKDKNCLNKKIVIYDSKWLRENDEPKEYSIEYKNNNITLKLWWYKLSSKAQKLKDSLLLSRDWFIIDNKMLKKELIESLNYSINKGFNKKRKIEELCKVYEKYNLDCPK